MSDDSVDSSVDMERIVYLEERKLLIQAAWTASAAFDKAMLALSSGALALSLIYVEKVTKHVASVGFLVASWAFLVAALCSVLAGLRASEKAMERQGDILDNAYEQSNPEVDESNHWSNATEWLNWISIACFIAGVVCLLCFACLNPPS